MRLRLLIIIGMAVLLSLSAAPAPSAARPTHTPKPTRTTKPTKTPRPSITATATRPPATATATPTPSVTPTVTPAIPGEYRIIAGTDMAAVNAIDLEPGDRLLFEAGASFGSLWIATNDCGTEAAPVFIGSYGAGRATLISAYIECGGVTVDGLDFVAPVGGAGGVFFYSESMTVPPPVAVRNVHVEGGSGDCLTFGTRAGSVGFAGITVEDADLGPCVLSGLATWAEAPNAHRNVAVTRVTAHDNPGNGAIRSNSGNGIVIGDAVGVVVANSIARNNGGSNGTAFGIGGPCGLWAYNSADVVFAENVVTGQRTESGVDGCGIDIDINTGPAHVLRNRSEGNQGPGYLAGYAHDVTFEANIAGQTNGGGPFALFGPVENLVLIGNDWQP